MTRAAIILLAVLALLPRHAGAQEEDTTALARRFREGIEAAQQGRLPEAVAALEWVAKEAPDIPNVHWNLGLWYAELEQPAKALAAWQAYRRLEPDDWRARAKVIQAFQALGDTLRRDRERRELLALHQAGTDPDLARETVYCREQFRVGERKVMVFEYFEPAGARRVYYAFHVLKPDGGELGRYSLGSYDQTTLMARELGQIGKDERMYHLDWYHERGHATHGFYRALPGYEEVRAQVVAAMTGERPPLSSTTRSQ